MTAYLLPASLSTRHDQGAIGPVFDRWQDLTDAYARQLEALRRREPGALAELARISKDLAEFQNETQPSH